MAGPNAIQQLGESLVSLLQSGLRSLVTADRIYLAGADEIGSIDMDQPVVTAYLYQVGVNAETRNGPQRTLADGRRTRPLLPIDLHFMITPWTRNRRDEYQIAGWILQLLYDNAELGPAQLQGDDWAPGDSVQIILESLPLDDLYRIWDSTSESYRLSLTYLVRVIGIEPAESTRESRVLDAEIRRLRNE